MNNVLEMWEKAPFGNELQKALSNEKEEQARQAAKPKSAIIDPADSYGVGGTRSKQAIIPFGTLRAMAKIPAVAAILLTRKNQVARHARRPRFDGDIGFKIGLKDNKKMTEAQAKRAHEIEDFFLKTGFAKNRKRKDNFNTFLRKIVDDTLTLDVMAWENVATIGGRLAEVWALDGSTIELVSNAPVSDAYEPIVYQPMTNRGKKIAGEIAYVQRINGQIVAEYTEDELAYAIRNPRTDILTTDFGMSELEVLMEIVTGILNGVRYNTTYFTHSHLPQGVLSFVGNYDDKTLEGFKRHWKSMTSGAAGKWAVPVLAAKEGAGFQWTPLKQSNQDMQFNEFLEFLFNIACAVYQIDPNEVGFKSWTSNSGNAMGQSDNTAEKMDKSKDKGLIPLMNFLSDTFNSEIVDQIDDEYEFYWVGLDEDDEDRKIERQEKEINMGTKTVAMVWEENDVNVDAIKEANGGKLPMWANAPANATLIQVFMAEQGLGQQEQGGDPNDPDAEQAAADDQHAKTQELQDDGHEKELEKMKLQHAQTMEAKKADQQHQLKLEQVKADNAKEAAEDQADREDERSKQTSEDDKGKDKGDDKPDPDDQHEKELEKMKLEHEHDMELERLKQKGKPKPASTVKKSLTDEEDTLRIVVSWDNY